eukprot:m.21873 g.21873  ORF g.21873 m.21873 type:complete len:408 (+) comp11173_c0_seq1:73-1296(+)
MTFTFNHLACICICLLTLAPMMVKSDCVPIKPGTNNACSGGNSSKDCSFACSCTGSWTGPLSYTCQDVSKDNKLLHFAQLTFEGFLNWNDIITFTLQGTPYVLEELTPVYVISIAYQNLSIMVNSTVEYFNSSVLTMPCASSTPLDIIANTIPNTIDQVTLLVARPVSNPPPIPTIEYTYQVETRADNGTWVPLGKPVHSNDTFSIQKTRQCDVLQLRAQTYAHRHNSDASCSDYTYGNISLATGPAEPYNFVVSDYNMELGTITVEWLPGLATGGCDDITFTVTWTVGGNPQRTLNNIPARTERSKQSITLGFDAKYYTGQQSQANIVAVSSGGTSRAANIYFQLPTSSSTASPTQPSPSKGSDDSISTSDTLLIVAVALLAVLVLMGMVRAAQSRKSRAGYSTVQ